MSRLNALRQLKRTPSEADLRSVPEPAPLPTEESRPAGVKRPAASPNLAPAFAPSDIAKSPNRRCGHCAEPATRWAQVWCGEGYKYFHNGVQTDGPALSAFCSERCAAEANPGCRVNFLSRVA
jgi:hypothetical protein